MVSEFAAIEKKAGGRLGVAIYNSASGERVGYRADERFPMCSTFKALAAAAILHRVDEGRETLERRVTFRRESLVEYSPVTEKFAGTEGMTVGKICEAAVTYSDNTAGNLMLEALGGPAAWTAYVRSLGDPVTRLDRNEPALNMTVPGDPRDTTSPNAMLADCRALIAGNALKPASREILIRWLKANTTGGARLRAGVPGKWMVGDKTGTASDTGTANDIAVMWPPEGKPIFAAVFLTAARVSPAEQSAAIAAVGRVLSEWISA
jgi:beta-lactamase class A